MSACYSIVSAPPAAAATVVECLSPSILLNALAPRTGLALWRRSARPGLHKATAALLGLPPFCLTAEAAPDQAARILLRRLPVACRPLGEDVALLGRLFATLTGSSTVRLRLEHIADNACRRHHVDAVGLRLLCTYAGLGTEWIDPGGPARRMATFEVGVFKGSAFPDTATRVLHRSPPVEHLPPSRRSRLLLCIDEPGAL
jgi:Protein of unknown function (DUF1826)